MTSHRLVMPQLGQAMEFGVIAEWLVADGARVRTGQPIASVESDKATYEIEATADGALRHMAAVGDEVPVGQPLAEIAGSDGAASATSPQGAYAIPPEAATGPAAAPVVARAASASDAGGRTLASPKARASARSLGVDLSRVAAHREDGLITAADVEAAAAAARPLASPKARGLADSLGVELTADTPHRPDRLIVAADVEAAAAARKAATKPATEGAPLTRLRRIGADRLARSWRQAPHFVQMIEVDATRLSKATGLMRRAGVAGALNDVLIKVAADCVARHPALNARFDDDKLIPFAEISVGLAVATDDGLTVPVVRAANSLSLAEVAAATRDLVAAARSGKLSGRQLGGASLTISNLGAYGIAFGTPVLNLDEPVLIFVGAIEERPVGRNGQIVLCPMTTLSVCFDHRVVDGLQAALFSRALKQRLESLEGLVPDDASAPAAAQFAERQLEARVGWSRRAGGLGCGARDITGRSMSRRRSAARTADPIRSPWSWAGSSPA